MFNVHSFIFKYLNITMFTLDLLQKRDNGHLTIIFSFINIQLMTFNEVDTRIY